MRGADVEECQSGFCQAAHCAPRMRRRGGRRLSSVLVPAALTILRAADAADGAYFSDPPPGNPNVMGYGPAAGALIIHREDLVRLRTSLGRVSDELHLILGVLDQHLSSPPMPASTNWPENERAREGPRIATHHAEPVPREPPMPSQADEPKDFVSASAGWAWTVGEWIVWVALIVLDVGIVVMMQMFLESIGRKRGGGSIASKKSATSLASAKAASTAGAPSGTPMPAPSTATTQRLSVLSQEELLAAALSEHWSKVAIGLLMAVLCRLPAVLLSPDSLTCNMLMNLTIMVRCMSVVMVFLGDDMALPKKASLNPPPGPPGTSASQ